MEANVVTAVTVLWFLSFPVLRVGSVTTMPDPVTFKNAWAYCSQNHGQLLADRDGQERALLKNVMVQKNWSTVWLAIEGTKSKNFIWLDGHEEASDEKWPDSYNCGLLNPNAEYIDRKSCGDTSYGYLCEGNATSCNSEGAERHKCIEAGGRAFVYSCESSSWYQARATCAEGGMTLAVIQDPVLQKKLFRQKDMKKCGMWVGLRREDWFYISNNGTRDLEILDPKWGRSEPSSDGKCVVLHKTGENFQWKVVRCTSAHHTACFGFGIPGDGSTTPHSYPSVTMKDLKSTTEAHPSGNGVNIPVIFGVTGTFLVTGLTIIVIYVLVKRNKKSKSTAEDEEERFVLEESNVSMDPPQPPPYDTNTDWYADSKGGRYSGEYKIELFIPGGAVPEGQTYKISRLISNDIFSCQAVTGHENHRVICPVVQFECLDDFLKPVTIHLPHAVAKQQLLKEVRVLFQEPGTTKWFVISTDNTLDGRKTERNSIVLVGDQNANKDATVDNLFMRYKTTVKTINIHTQHLGKFMCSMPAPSLEDTSLSAMLFAHVIEDPSDKIVQEVFLQAVVLDNMYNLPCFKQIIYEEYGGKPVKENILITLPSDSQIGDRGILQVNLGTREEEDWQVLESSSSEETKVGLQTNGSEEIKLSELHERLKNELGILVCEIHLQNKGNKMSSVMVTACLSVRRDNSENGQSYYRTPVTKNFRVPLRPPEDDLLQGDSGCASSTKGSSTKDSRGTSDSGRIVKSPTTYNKPRV